ncbi:putative hydrolase of the HAD superfamily [Algoriphagus ratkowskyi]|uniref:Noncanonical pyrimidine nucleotidase, YjjG family n=1 Tax=Algoriphagus ratkowskyi TaxID=57028 RepID=A0A2W7RVF4_9BACT|nr:YjjG family noncanonical pyrimidine nucleotidase [Algoriphagus ratkowskyi]PZX59197.1 putative hydrolase of the HAD superfamily [Algoriphagus ratkowskyi]TXD77519.1 noncanonical pyrimidine nucleotidase, YjjG family [Algoriphagus ratkowskyi]
MKTYQHLFFDLDHTLWDYDRNVQESLSELFIHYQLENLGVVSSQHFIDSFYAVNFKLWAAYDKGEMHKEELRTTRFPRIFAHAGIIDAAIPEEFESDFMHRTSSKPHLFPHTIEILDYLKPKYKLYVITNGFDESQARKMKSSGLSDYFELVVTSETTGHKKPDPRIFQFALEQAGAKKECSLMIGDNPISDIQGAHGAGIDQVFFNPLGNSIDFIPTYTITHLRELEDLL